MNNEQIRIALENKGYKITIGMSSGNYIVSKGNTRYVFEDLQNAKILIK